MKTTKGKTADEIIRKLDPKKKEITGSIRELIRKTLPNATEAVKWGNITYLLNGKNLAWLLFYKEHVDFGFFMGSKLKSALLEGTGKNLRHIKIRTKEDINKKEFSRLLKDAAKLARKPL